MIHDTWQMVGISTPPPRHRRGTPSFPNEGEFMHGSPCEARGYPSRRRRGGCKNLDNLYWPSTPPPRHRRGTPSFGNEGEFMHGSPCEARGYPSRRRRGGCSVWTDTLILTGSGLPPRETRGSHTSRPDSYHILCTTLQFVDLGP